MSDRERSDSTIQTFLSGVERRVTGEEGHVPTSLSDRELAAIAWPEGPPDGFGGEAWSELDATRCDAAITAQLQTE